MTDLQEAWVDRALSLEASLNRLIEELHVKHAGVTRDDRQVVAAKLFTFMTELEALILRDPSAPPSERERRLTKIQQQADQLALLQAERDRLRRATLREVESLDIERRATELRQQLDEIDAEFGTGGER